MFMLAILFVSMVMHQIVWGIELNAQEDKICYRFVLCQVYTEPIFLPYLSFR